MAHKEPEPYPWYIRAVGDSDTRVFTWTDSTGAAIDLTGYTVKLIVDHSALRTEITIDSSLIDETAGKVTAEIPSGVSSLFTVKYGSFKLTVTKDGDPKTIAFGPLVVASK